MNRERAEDVSEGPGRVLGLLAHAVQAAVSDQPSKSCAGLWVDDNRVVEGDKNVGSVLGEAENSHVYLAEQAPWLLVLACRFISIAASR